MPTTMAHHKLTTKAPTSGVKYKPSVVPMIHCPQLRKLFALRVGRPTKEPPAVTNKGPNIQGMGVRIHWHISAAHRAKNKVTAICSKLRSVRPDLLCVTTDAVGQCPDDLINL